MRGSRGGGLVAEGDRCAAPGYRNRGEETEEILAADHPRIVSDYARKSIAIGVTAASSSKLTQSASNL